MVKPTPNKITGRYGMNSLNIDGLLRSRSSIRVGISLASWACLAVSKPLYQPLTTLLLSTKKKFSV